MKNTRNICILGDGGWGTTLGILLFGKGFSLTMWGAFPEYIDILIHKRENVKFLPGIKIPEEVRMTASLDEALESKEIVILAIPSQFMRGVLAMLKTKDLSEKIFISVTKGVENNTLKRMSEVIREVLGAKQKIAILSGPSIALEVANGAPTTVVVSSEEIGLAKEAQEIFMTDRFRVYTTSDVIGVELGGALKNIIAIAAGISDALGFGTNAKSALLTRGLAEIARLGAAMGGRKETFYGLSGLGDLTTTCISRYSRNRWLGEQIANGKKLKDILKETDMVIEGVATSESAYDLSRKYNIEMPITCEIYRILYDNKDPKQAVRDLMTRSPKMEEG